MQHPTTTAHRTLAQAPRCRTARPNAALAAWCAAALFLATAPAAQAHREASEASGLSLLPVAVSVAAPVSIVVGGAMLTVSAVEVSAEGTVWVLERASDGARASVRLAGKASVATGTVLTVTAVATGWVLSTAGVAVAIVPSAVGRALMHDERISR